MSNYIAAKTPGGTIWVQIEGTEDGSLLVNTFQNEAFDSFDDVASAIKTNAQFLYGKLAELAPSSIEISFGINAFVSPQQSSRLPIFGLSKGTDEANYKVKLKW